jgi:predicted DCC family thiol-disulfide oxidoreductase YuxK
MGDDAPVVLFDGTCNFCDGAVHFMIDHERGSALRFAALQSEPGTALLDRSTTPEKAKELREGVTGDGDPDSLALVENGHVYTHSTGALRIARYLRWPWSWFAAFWIVPRPIRDAVYRWFARHRYAWFGKTSACRVPTPEFRARFL